MQSVMPLSVNEMNVLTQEHRRPLAASVHATGQAAAAAKPAPPPRAAARQSTSSAPRRGQARPESECDPVTGTSEGDLSSPAPLDRHRSLHVPVAPLEGGSLTRHRPRLMSDETDDYSEIYSPDDGAGGGEGEADATDALSRVRRGKSNSRVVSTGGRSGSGDSGLTGLSSAGSSGLAAAAAASAASVPPPPPAHRYPSWEDRIYQVASEGLGDADVSANGNNNRNSLCGYGDDINVPVYASVKGVSVYGLACQFFEY